MDLLDTASGFISNYDNIATAPFRGWDNEESIRLSAGMTSDSGLSRQSQEQCDKETHAIQLDFPAKGGFNFCWRMT